jgi:dTDP-4-amino-4,6-dideoxygalactose transaminase
MSTDAIRVLIPRLPTAARLLPYLERIDASRVYSNYGPMSREFGDRLANRVGAAGVTLTCNGTAAIELALRARARVGHRYCLMPAFTFIATAHAVCNAGLTPFFLEVDRESLMLTPAIVEAVLPSLDQPPAAIVVVSAFGAPPDFSEWALFEARHGIPVVFDAAAAVTALNSIGEQPICVSLHATKLLGIGEGGAIFSDDDEFIARTTAMTGFGFLGAERVAALRGGNYRISEYAAAIGMAALDELPGRLTLLRKLTSLYQQRLEGKKSHLQQGIGDWLTMTLNVLVPAEHIESTLQRLDAAKIQWRRWWGLGCHLHPAFAGLPRTDLAITNNVAQGVVGLPFHDQLSEDDIARVTACLP